MTSPESFNRVLKVLKVFFGMVKLTCLLCGKAANVACVAKLCPACCSTKRAPDRPDCGLLSHRRPAVAPETAPEVGVLAVPTAVSSSTSTTQSCKRSQLFFTTLSPHVWPAYVDEGHRCKGCGRGVSEHSEARTATDETTVVAADLRSGAAYERPQADGEVFRDVIKSVERGPFCADDHDGVQKNVVELDTSMHNGTSSFIVDTFEIAGPADLSRKFVLKSGALFDVRAQQELGRNLLAIEKVGVAFVSLCKYRARHRHFVMRAVLPVSRDRCGLSTEIVALESILKDLIEPTVGVLVPEEKHWVSSDTASYWGLLVATTRPQFLLTAMRSLVVKAGERYHRLHADRFWDKATWEYKYERLAAARPVADRSARPTGVAVKRVRDGDAGAGAPRKKQRPFRSKADREAHQAAKAAKKDDGAVEQDESAPAAGSLAGRSFATSDHSTAPTVKPDVQPSAGSPAGGGRGGRGSSWFAPGRGSGRSGGRF